MCERGMHKHALGDLLHHANPLRPLRFTCSGAKRFWRHNCDPSYVSGRSSAAFLGDIPRFMRPLN